MARRFERLFLLGSHQSDARRESDRTHLRERAEFLSPRCPHDTMVRTRDLPTVCVSARRPGRPASRAEGHASRNACDLVRVLSVRARAHRLLARLADPDLDAARHRLPRSRPSGPALRAVASVS